MLNYYYIQGPKFTDFDYDRLFHNPKLFADDLLVGIYFPKERSAIEGSFKVYKDVCGVDLPEAFNELQFLSPVIASSFLVFAGKDSNRFNNTFGYIHKHVHPPMLGVDRKYIEPTRRTTTAVVPTKIVGSVSETLCVQQIDYEFLGKDYVNGSYQNAEWLESLPTVGDVIRIRMPNEGEYLMLDFQSSHMLHWIENDMDSENEFICLVNDL